MKVVLSFHDAGTRYQLRLPFLAAGALTLWIVSLVLISSLWFQICWLFRWSFRLILILCAWVHWCHACLRGPEEDNWTSWRKSYGWFNLSPLWVLRTRFGIFTVKFPNHQTTYSAADMLAFKMPSISTNLDDIPAYCLDWELILGFGVYRTELHP